MVLLYIDIHTTSRILIEICNQIKNTKIRSQILILINIFITSLVITKKQIYKSSQIMLAGKLHLLKLSINSNKQKRKISLPEAKRSSSCWVFLEHKTGENRISLEFPPKQFKITLKYSNQSQFGFSFNEKQRLLPE